MRERTVNVTVREVPAGFEATADASGYSVIGDDERKTVKALAIALAFRPEHFHIRDLGKAGDGLGWRWAISGAIR